MATARKFEDLEVWSNSRDLVKKIYRATVCEPARCDLAFCGQIRRAAVRVMSNIAEGFGRYSDKEFARYLDIARGSLMETQSLLYVAVDIEYIDTDTFRQLTEASSKLVAQLTTFGQYLRNTGAA
ncbi:MAG: four helix bundle protein [Rhodothermales bacterium]